MIKNSIYTVLLISFLNCFLSSKILANNFKQDNLSSHNLLNFNYAQNNVNKIDLESLGLDNQENFDQDNIVQQNENKFNNIILSKNKKNNNDSKQFKIVTEPQVEEFKKKSSAKNNKNKSYKNPLVLDQNDEELKQEKIINKIKEVNNQKKQKLSSRLLQEEKLSKINNNNSSIDNQFNIKDSYIHDNNIINEQYNFELDRFEENTLTSFGNNIKNINKNSKISSLELRNKKQILNYLRRLYLGQEKDPKIEKLKIIDNDFNDNEIIIPKPKNLNRFIQDELPAYPILSPLRNEDNFHIPSIISPKQKIDTLFYTINIGDVKSFVEIYKQVKNPNIQNDYGDTLLTKSIILKRYDITAEILMKGADPDLPNSLGYTPLEIAIELLDFRAMQLLVENRANINSVDRFGRTYLMHASRVGLLPAVDLLVKNGADINATDNDGFSALSIAYRHKKEIIVQYLLKNGAQQWIERKNIPSQQKLILELQGRWK